MEYFDILQLGMFDSFLWATNVLYHWAQFYNQGFTLSVSSPSKGLPNFKCFAVTFQQIQVFM